MGLLTPLAVKIGSIPWLPRYLRQIMWVDNLIRRVTRGRLTLLDLAGLPNLVLTVPGRKSGIPRSTPLLCAPDGPDILIAGSNFGGAKEPIWVKNIEATREVTVFFRRRETPMVVRPLEGDERAAAWSLLVETWPNFLMYEKRTDRQIKLFRLTAQP
ncbi:nitroreductase family deazaflavin-dependent oxidoreductase [Aeromicrobium ginsengisoli]|uniref:Nitroreductase family deazaflavin-dependent oxidoreductase n=1 Tax=Aeromicrobium ginsengisoli TaxID=363867 RepID=A0A5M4FC25_9ACTN|nr:nitroreductase family deazaflavin-dependent oxidoreductase [Aeromicrobium ginsengisoli]KAA1395948.1 nitroreductase family deazaflavin-dependent oxidoreductase [Aeromicrobium ginsengisoli]